MNLFVIASFDAIKKIPTAKHIYGVGVIINFGPVIKISNILGLDVINVEEIERADVFTLATKFSASKIIILEEIYNNECVKFAQNQKQSTYRIKIEILQFYKASKHYYLLYYYLRHFKFLIRSKFKIEFVKNHRGIAVWRHKHHSPYKKTSFIRSDLGLISNEFEVVILMPCLIKESYENKVRQDLKHKYINHVQELVTILKSYNKNVVFKFHPREDPMNYLKYDIVQSEELSGIPVELFDMTKSFVINFDSTSDLSYTKGVLNLGRTLGVKRSEIGKVPETPLQSKIDLLQDINRFTNLLIDQK